MHARTVVITSLILTDSEPDYGADYLAHGFACVGNMVDWPRKEGLHWTGPKAFDCNVYLPSRDMSRDEVETAISDGTFDVIVIPTLRRDVKNLLSQWKYSGILKKMKSRVVACDFEDHAMDTRTSFDALLGFSPAAYFKRELPEKASWAIPLPFGYPEDRTVPLGNVRFGPVFYGCEIWDWSSGMLRDRLASDLRRLKYGSKVVVLATGRGREPRMKLEDYHQALRRSRAAVVPSGAGWGTNRLLEVVAAGCLPILEDPWVQYPNFFIDGEDSLFFCEEAGAINCVDVALEDPDKTFQMALKAQKRFLAFHTTRHRAKKVLEYV